MFQNNECFLSKRYNPVYMLKGNTFEFCFDNLKTKSSKIHFKNNVLYAEIMYV